MSASDKLPFPEISAEHILHCSAHFWYSLYRSVTPKSRLIPLSKPFIEYLRADGIFLPPSPHDPPIPSASDDDSEGDPSLHWQEIHSKISTTIKELGSVYPKLNWSAPKDATWISATNSMECIEANDIYLLLKSSDFITHDLEHAFDGCKGQAEIPWTLVLRKSIPSIVTAMEFRCFVRGKSLLAITQRDLNHYPFLFSLKSLLGKLIQTFFDQRLKHTFPEEDFTFDVYIPQPREREKVWLMDLNPWAPRTDPLLFSWMELLQMEDPGAHEASFRLVGRDDPEAALNTPQYSAHKLPKDVVDASLQGGMGEFLGKWKDLLGQETRSEAAVEEEAA